MIIHCDTHEKLNQSVREIIEEVVATLRDNRKTVCLTKLPGKEMVKMIDAGVGDVTSHPNLHSISNDHQIVFWFED